MDMRRTKQDAEKTKQAILDSAMSIFCEKGYSKTTFDEIAKRINLTKGAVYWYFRNKPDIVAALINEFAGIYLQHIKSFLEQRQDISFDRITEMQLQVNRLLRKDEKFHQFMFFITCQMEWSEAILNKIIPTINQTKTITRDLFANALSELKTHGKMRKNVDIDMICDILMVTYGGALNAYFTRNLSNDFDEVIKTSYNLIFNNINTEDSTDEN